MFLKNCDVLTGFINVGAKDENNFFESNVIHSSWMAGMEYGKGPVITSAHMYRGKKETSKATYLWKFNFS